VSDPAASAEDIEAALAYLSGPAAVAERVRSETDEVPRSMLRLFFERLAGETVGDVARTLAAVTDDFALWATDPAATNVTGGAELAASVERLSSLAGQMLLWFDFDEILVQGASVAAFGTMHTTFSTAFAIATMGTSAEVSNGTLTKDSALSILCRYEEGRMRREDVMFIPSGSEMLHTPGAVLPSLESLSSALALLV
jgi:hypothetical protein